MCLCDVVCLYDVCASVMCVPLCDMCLCMMFAQLCMMCTSVMCGCVMYVPQALCDVVCLCDVCIFHNSSRARNGRRPRRWS